MKKDALLPAGYAFSESSKCIHTRYQVRVQTGRAKRVQHTVTAPSGIWILDRCRATSPSQEGYFAGRKLLFQIALQPWKELASRAAACTSPPLHDFRLLD
jgi:hypothetical protein